MTVQELYRQSTALLRTDVARAGELADQAAQLSRTPTEHAFALRARANVAWASGRYKEALELYREALARFESEGDALEGASTRNNALQTLIYLSRYDEALDWAAQAREIFTSRGETLRAARLDGNLANLLYRQDRFEEALRYYVSAEAVFRQCGQPQDVAAVLRNKAVCELSLSRYSSALETHRAAKSFCAGHGLAVLAAEADYNIAYLYFLRGDYLRARDLYRTAREAAAGAGDPYHVALCDLDRSEVYLELNLSAEGAELAEAAYAAFRKLRLGYESAKALAFRAIAAGQMGDFDRALTLLGRARRRFEAEKNAVWPPLSDLYAAILLEKAGRPAQARRRCERALGFFSKTVLPGKAVLARLLLARLDLTARRTRAARTHALAAQRMLEFAQSPSLAFHVWFTLGQLHEAEGDTARAEWKYSRAQEELEEMRDRLGVQTLQVAFAKDKLTVYESLFLLYFEQGDTGAAFRTVERARARAWSTAIDPLASANLPERVKQWRTELNVLYRQLDSVETTASPAAVEQIRRRVAALESDLRRELSEAPGEELPAAPSLTLEEVAAGIVPGTCLLEYFEAKGVLYCFVIGDGEAALQPVASGQRVFSLLRLLQLQISRFRNAAAHPGLPSPRHADVERHLRALYDELIRPVQHLLRGRRLLIAPHGFLHAVPFHALLAENEHVAEVFEVSYTPGASSHLRNPMTGSSGTEAAIFGVPDTSAPHIRREVDDVAEALPGAHVFLGEHATLARLRDVGPRCRYLHLATHGRFRKDNPLFSSIRLGDGYLSLYDLYGLRLNVDLAVLSGCSTGLGVVVGGDEVLGLVRGLLSAGVRSAVVTLWDTRDESAALFMRSFYGALQTGRSKTSAMQAAQTATRAAFPHPFDWAPYILVGKSDGGSIFHCGRRPL